jgi:hypothetical protein
MKIYPSKTISFDLIDSQTETLERLKRRTDYSESLTSQVTDKSFRGEINGNQFQLISSTPGFGAFCKLSGTVEKEGGSVKVEIHPVFRIVLVVFYLLPVAGLLSEVFSSSQGFNPIMILVAALQILLIRFFLDALAFRYLSQISLNRLRDVLDVKMR